MNAGSSFHAPGHGVTTGKLPRKPHRLAPLQFRRGLFAIIALALAALPVAVTAPAASAAYRIEGAELIAPATATWTRSGGNVLISGWSGNEAALRRPTNLAAADYRFARVSMRGAEPSQRIFLGWKAATEDGEAHAFAYVPWTGRSAVTIALPDDWQGRILELALGIRGQPGQAIQVASVSLLSDTPAAQLAALRDRALAYTSWDFRSSNNIAASTRGHWLSPVSFAGLLATALIVLGVLGCRVAGARIRGLGLFVAVTLGCLWLALDLLWQRRLMLQVAVTRETFAGLAGAERALADEDAWLYRLAQQLAPHIPLDPLHRLFLVHESEGHNFERLKLQYHLLPRNTYNFGDRLPAMGTYRTGDHVLLLGRVNGIVFDEKRGQLVDPEHALSATLIRTAGSARLFRLERAIGGPAG